jgi:alpha-beta hydrolase superfamily lysophospholipase
VGGVKVSLLRYMAIALGQSGVATLRCDDRGVGESGGGPDGLVLGALATDVAAQVAALRREPGVDGERVGILGHGEGATLAQLVAAEDSAIRALALLSPMGRTLDEVSLDQREVEMRRLGVKEDIIRDERKRMAAVYLAVRSGKPPPKGTPAETVAALAPMLPYLASHFRFDPIYTARKVKAAVLIAHGEKDTVITPSDAKLLRDHYRKARNPRVTLKRYPDLNHFFTPAKAGTAQDFSDPSLSVDPSLVGDVVTFLSSSL